MSCFHCYLSPKLAPCLVDKVIEQGQKLRSAMVQSILNNDPFYRDAFSEVKSENLDGNSDGKITAYLRGDAMSKRDEILALETLRSMSGTDLCRVTSRAYSGGQTCDCPTCFAYETGDVSCDVRREKYLEKPKKSAFNYGKFIDSLRVYVGSIVLNEAGNKKVFDSLAEDKKNRITQTYFVEYQIPESLVRKQLKTKARVDSGLDNSPVRFCARCSYEQEIIFKQTSVHDVVNLDNPNWQVEPLKFKISSRGFKQKHPNLLGIAEFDFSSLTAMKNFSSHQEISIKSDKNSPFAVGVLRVALQLGCDRLYFGSEFIDTISAYKENSVTGTAEVWSKPSLGGSSKLTTPRISAKSENRQQPSAKTENIPNSVENKPILFGFIYVSEAQFSREILNSFVTCQTFGLDDVTSSKVVALNSNPVYNFRQEVPLVYEEELLGKLRDNYMVVEFWEKGKSKDFVVGLTKLPLHTFYLAFRNPVIVKYLCERKAPIIGSDCWQSIYSPAEDEIVGRALILCALGTKEQIDNLETERGFKRNLVKAKPSPVSKPVNRTIENDPKIAPTPLIKTTPQPTNDLRSPQKNISLDKSSSVQFRVRPSKIDIGVQSEMEAQPPNDIEALLNQLISQNPRNIHVENATNTEATGSGVAQPEMKKTSDLLDSLQKASSPLEGSVAKPTFRAQILINDALHLPSRKKCKSKKSRNKNGKHEDILPSTYVTFESANGNFKMTPIVPKSTNPKWGYRCDVVLPVEYLTNSQKRLVFKVWRKSTNTTMTPNLQTDVVLGFAALDLTVLLAGLPNVQGWFNITDFSNKCNGQINIHVTPLENISKFQPQKDCCSSESPPEAFSPVTTPDEPGELLGRALKRKFSELDEITQRLRLRLSKVTNDESDTSNDEMAEEFERDINTLCVEDDFDTVDFEQEATHFSLNRMKEVGLLQAEDKNLFEGKQKIDALLEKLSLISGENSRYVSGCSDRQVDTEAILNDLDHFSRPNIHSSLSFDKAMNEKFEGWETSESDQTAPGESKTD